MSGLTFQDPKTPPEIKAEVTKEAFSAALEQMTKNLEEGSEVLATAQEALLTIMGNVVRLVEAVVAEETEKEKALVGLADLARLSDGVMANTALVSNFASPQRELFEDDPGLIVGADLKTEEDLEA